MRHLFKTLLCTFLLFALLVLSLATYAQQKHFIYIQADNQQLFSVELNGKYYSSSSIGYIILPKLSDSTYMLKINFAKNSYPEQSFTINVNGKDYGYALKNFGDKGWGLFNFQTTDVIMNNTVAPQDNSQAQASATTNTSAFGAMLADAVNDQSINTLSNTDTVTIGNKNVEAAATVPDTQTSTTTQNDDVAKATDTLNTMAAGDSSTNDTTTFNTTGVIKSEENVGEKGTDLTFIDFNGDHSDTIRAFIPAATEGKKHKKSGKTDVNETAAVADSTKGKVNNPFFGQNNTGDSSTVTTANPNLIGGNEDSNSTSTLPTSTAMVNDACTNMVSDHDLDKLKKRIVGENDQDAILQTVKKGLKNKCITTTQVKDLGNLFLSDDNRYGFYEIVYPFVYDYGNYASLQNTLIDPYYKKRFQALLR